MTFKTCSQSWHWKCLKFYFFLFIFEVSIGIVGMPEDDDEIDRVEQDIGELIGQRHVAHERVGIRDPVITGKVRRDVGLRRREMGQFVVPVLVERREGLSFSEFTSH